MDSIFIRQSFIIYYARFDSNVLTLWLWKVWQVKLWHRDHKGYPCYDFVWKNNRWESCHRTLELRPTCMKNIKIWRGQTRAMHWCYKVVDSTLICHFSLAFELGHSANPPRPNFSIALLIAASMLLQSFVLVYCTVWRSVAWCWRPYGRWRT